MYKIFHFYYFYQFYDILFKFLFAMVTFLITFGHICNDLEYSVFQQSDFLGFLFLQTNACPNNKLFDMLDKKLTEIPLYPIKKLLFLLSTEFFSICYILRVIRRLYDFSIFSLKTLKT